MTYGIGFKTDKAAFLIADGLISEKPKNKELEEAFGQFSTTGRLLQNKTYTFTESLQKVREIDEGMLATFATNDVDGTLQALDDVKTLIDAGRPIEKAFSSAFRKIENIEILFSYSEKGEPKLFSFNLNKDRLINEHHSGEVVAIGSGKHHSLLHENSKNFIESTIKNVQNDPADMLAHALGGLTSIMSSSHLLSVLDYQVGGNLFGGYVTGTSSHMMKDTLYIFYTIVNGNLKVQNEVSILNSPSLNLIYSSFGDKDDGRFIGYSNDKKASKEDRHKVYKQLLVNYLNGKLEYAVGIDTQKPVYFLCKQKNHRGFKFRSFNKETSKIQVCLHPSIVADIKKNYKSADLLSGGYKRINTK
ncbi:hypothetical protein LT343_27515 [Bacillus toyonensis]|uniref:hypothetical protein n=1 Tax=Bacillus toyonensis TaxID=155322 RepID=UPI001EDD8321|nr:hypothetical protein [Bacillus toyonensis]MCG3797045.1 hypothetical protein [Bacillus toyonensis]